MRGGSGDDRRGGNAGAGLLSGGCGLSGCSRVALLLFGSQEGGELAVDL
jgi:hypothetical protein